MFARLGRLAAHHARAALIIYAVIVIACGAAASQAFGNLQTEGYDNPSSDSARAARIIAANFDGATIATIAVRTPQGLDQDAPAAKSLLAKVAALPGVSYVDSYWRAKAAALAAADARTGYAVVVSRGDVTDRAALAAQVTSTANGQAQGLQVEVRPSPDAVFGASDPAVVLAIATPRGIDRDRAAAASILAKVAATPGVSSIQSYWDAGANARALASIDGKSAMALVNSKHGVDAGDLATTLAERVGGQRDGVTVFVGGRGAVAHALTTRTKHDVAIAEAFTVPLLLVMLLFAFGSLVASGLPFLVAIGAIAGSFAAIWGISQVANVSVFATNLITGFGLGLGIDYALLMINRFRECLSRGLDVEAAVVETVTTAGRTVFVSGLTVAMTLGGLLIFPQYFMKSFAYSGFIVVALAVASSLIALPAALRLIGPRIDSGKVLRGDLAPTDEGVWQRIAVFTMRRARTVFAVVLVALVAMAAPALSATFGQIDDRALPASDSAAVASAFIREAFDSKANAPIEILVPSYDCASASDTSALSRFMRATLGGAAGTDADGAAWRSHITAAASPVGTLSRIGDALRFTPTPAARMCGSLPAAYQPETSWARISIISDLPARDTASSGLVGWLRATADLPPGAVVGGAPAVYKDQESAITGGMPWLLAWLAASTVLILFLFTGSVLLPLKAVAMNVLSLGATLGVLTMIFGHHIGAWLVGGFTDTGVLDSNTLVLVGVVAFGLSMDYEVFLLARIKEEHDRGADTERSVALGLQRSGRIITTAALLLAAVFAAFIFSGITSIKLLGFGIAFAILLDASVVRGLLVPSFMKLAGRWNWWAPAPLARLQRRFGLSES